MKPYRDAEASFWADQ